MIKKLTILLLSALMLTGCADEEVMVQQITETQLSGFTEYTQDNSNYSILVDNETKVCYLKYIDTIGYHSYFGITLMLNADGTPKLWEGK